MELEMDRRQRIVVGVLFPAWFLGITIVPWVLTLGDLPGPIANHFDRHGDADGHVPLVVHMVFVAFFTVASSAVLLWAAWRRGSRLGAEVVVATFLGWLIGMINAILLNANHGHDRWQDVTIGSGAVWGAVLSAFGAALPVALMVRHGARMDEAAASRTLPLSTSERAAWFGRTSSRLIATSVLLLVMMGTMVLLALGSGAISTGVVLLLTGVAMISFMSVDVAVGEQGVRIRSGALHWPRMHFALDEIETARAVDWDPMCSGVVTGWGYRGSLRLMGRAGWVLRKGPALELELAGGRRFVVTTDDAEEAAAVLNGLLARRASSVTGPDP